jgi:hypothetical protein
MYDKINEIAMKVNKLDKKMNSIEQKWTVKELI